MRVAAIDIGTNSVLLLVAEEGPDGDLRAVLERATITRLGQGVDRTRALADEAVDRTLTCLASYAESLRSAGAVRLDAVGTSAMRDAEGGAAFAARAKALLGIAPRVVSGHEEATLTFEGALSGLDLPDDEAVTVFDVGGGSTEVIARGADGVIRTAVSLDIGSVRLTERHMKSDPPSAAEIEAVRADARRALASVTFPASAVLVGVAGTVTTLAAHALGVAPYDGARVHGARLTAERVREATAELAALPLARRAALPALDPKRADVIVAGAVLVEEVMARAGASGLVASDRGVRWGLAARLVKGPAPT